MRRAAIALVVLATTLAACGTPEVARRYETRAYLPQELEAALRSDDPARRADAASQVESMPAERRRAVLVSLAGDEQASVRLMAVTLLGEHHPDDREAVSALAGVLSLDVDLDVRSAAVAALAGSRAPEAVRALVRVLGDDPSLIVRREAAEALDRSTGRPFGADAVERADAAQEAADEAAMSYEEWVEESGGNLRYDDEAGRFVESGE